MEPALCHGAVVDVEAAFFELIRGDVIVARHPYKRGTLIVKRIVQITEDRRYFVEGDNLAQSTDSRSFGPIRHSEILGRVIF